MYGKYKTFDQQTYNEENARAVAAVLLHLHSQGIHAVENPDKYGVDILVYTGFRPTMGIEVEVKRVWSGPNFPWGSVQLPERKHKLTKTGFETDFYILNRECNSAIVIPGLAVDLKFLKEVPNSNIRSGEMFFQIPVEECTQVDLLVTGDTND